jgi:hypothetical protein
MRTVLVPVALLLTAVAEAAPAPIEALTGVHPRLLLTQDEIESLRPRLLTTHRFLWERYQQDLPRMVAVSKRLAPLEDARYDGDLVPELAFAWLMTGDAELLQVARAQLARLTSGEAWDANEDLAYLVPGHYLLGVALGYDWLYSALTPAERKTVADRLGREAEAQYQRIASGRIWWRNQYYQNHSHSNTCALAFAAAALQGEDPRAPRWMQAARDFFAKTFEVMPADGGSLEGYAYAGYGAEYLLKYALLSRDLLGRDESDNPWMRRFSTYLLHGLLPLRTSSEWAMTFGDAPRRGWTSTAQHLYTLAALYRDGAAQWMANTTVGLADHGLGSHGWMMLLGYDPTVAAADPAGFPTFQHFPEIDQVMMRSSWTDDQATLVGFKCGPFMGKTRSRQAIYDYGTGHEHPDAGSFQVFSHGQFLAIDPLYTGYKLSADHNTMLFKGHGQLGEQAGFGSVEALRFGHYPEILHARSEQDYDLVVGDVTLAYHPALGLKRFLRHLLFVKPDILLVADEVTLDEHGIVHDYPPAVLRTAGKLTHAPNDYVVGSEGEAFLELDGEPGRYRIVAVYLDNVPEAGDYSFEVDGRVVHRWKSHNQSVDDHLIAVSPPVALKRGSRVAFRGAPMAPACRLVKMSVFSDEVTAPRQAQWLLHLDPKAALRELGGRLEATLGGASLDVYRLAPAGGRQSHGLHDVAKPEVEPFTFRKTLRIVYEPPWTGQDVGILTMLASRAARTPALEDVQGTLEGRRVRASWSRDGARSSLEWNLETREVTLR